MQEASVRCKLMSGFRRVKQYDQLSKKIAYIDYIIKNK